MATALYLLLSVGASWGFCCWWRALTKAGTMITNAAFAPPGPELQQFLASVH